MKTKEQIENRIEQLKSSIRVLEKEPSVDWIELRIIKLEERINQLTWVLQDDQFIDVEGIVHKRWMVKE